MNHTYLSEIHFKKEIILLGDLNARLSTLANDARYASPAHQSSSQFLFLAFEDEARLALAGTQGRGTEEEAGLLDFFTWHTSPSLIDWHFYLYHVPNV